MTSDFIIGSGNVYEDLGHPDAQEMALKAQLVREITRIIIKRKLSQKDAASILGIDAPKVCALIKGKFSGYSVERLFRFLHQLDQEIVITVRQVRRRKNTVAKPAPPRVARPAAIAK